MEYNMLAKRSE